MTTSDTTPIREVKNKMIDSSKAIQPDAVDKPMKLLSFDQICGKEYNLEIKSPNGTRSSITLKALTDGQMSDIRKTVVWPTRKVSDLQKDHKTGNIIKIFNEELYQEELAEANSELAYKLLVATIISIDIPGDNDQEKAFYLRNSVDSWATKQLSTEMLRLVGVGEEAIDEAISDFQKPTS